MPLITELKYNANDFNNIDLDDLIVVFEGDITIVHSNDYSEYNIQRIINLLHRLCDRFYNMTYEIFSDNGNLKPLYANNNYQNIVSAVMQFAGFPKLIIGEIEESAKYNRWTLYIDNDWYDVLNSKELYQLIKTNLLSNYFDSVTINDKEYRLEDIISLKDNKMDDIPLANPLYNGNCEKYLTGILQKGLRKIQDNSAWAANNDGYVFLTADYQIAQNYADIYARKTNSHGVVIEIDSNYLNKNNIVLDYDFTNSFTGLGSKSPYGSGEVTYSKHYKGNIASNDKRYGTKFNKIGYKGVVMPKAIKNITIGKYSITPQEYLDKYNKENNVMESKQNIREWHYPDNFDSLPDTIILYHGTDYDGMENILIDGVIDARRGRSTGETRGMNWFFTSYKDNYSRGFVYSIDINKEEINKTSNGFNYMNDNEIASYEPISIDNRNFTIHEAFGYEIEDLKNVMWRRCLQQTNNDIYEAIYLWIDKFSKLSGAQEYDISINNVIIQQILKQFIGEDELRNQGIIENIEHINEVNSSDINLSSFKPKTELHPKLWVNNKLNSRVRLRLLDIADDFIDTLAVDWVKPKDIVFTGSLANYNWSRYSDIDIHVILDYDKVYKKKEFVEDYFSSKKELWLNEHPKLSIYGFPIELYVEDSNEQSTSSGIYSLNKKVDISTLNFYFKKITKTTIKTLNDYFKKIITFDCSKKGETLTFVISEKSTMPSISYPYLPKKTLKDRNKAFTLVLDLDETLICFKINEKGKGMIRFRPGLDQFLQELSNLYEMIIFTAGTQDYADPILNEIENEEKYFSKRLYRQHSVIIDNTIVKDLSKLGRDLSKVIIIDNMPQNFRLQKENGIFIKNFYGDDHNDTALLDLIPILKEIASDPQNDVRVKLKALKNEIFTKITTNLDEETQ